MFCHSWAFLVQPLQSWLKNAAIWTRFFVQGMLHLLYGAFVCFVCEAHAAVGILPATVQQVGAAGVDLRQAEPPLFGRAWASQVETHKQNEWKTLSSEAPRQRLCDLFIDNNPLVTSWNKLDHQPSWNGFQCRNELWKGFPSSPGIIFSRAFLFPIPIRSAQINLFYYFF